MNFVAIKKICDIYDWDGKGVLDMYFFGDILYALVIMNALAFSYQKSNLYQPEGFQVGML